MLIIENDADKEKCTTRYGNGTFVLGKDEVLALLDGKMLGDTFYGEYGIFIVMEKEDTDET